MVECTTASRLSLFKYRERKEIFTKEVLIMDPKQAGSSTKSHSPYYFKYLVRINRTSQSVICLVILLFYVPALVDLLYRSIVTGILPYSSVIKIMNTLVTSVPGVRIEVQCIAMMKHNV